MPVSQSPGAWPQQAADPGAPMLRVLGRMSVRGGGRERPVGPPLRRLLLALLVVRRGQVVPTELLIEELWAGRPPKKPLAALQSHVSHLRGVLDPPAIRGAASALRHHPPGYVLLLPPSQIDVHRFEQLVHAGQLLLKDGDAAAACTTLTDALTLWQGSPYTEFEDSPTLAHEPARLEQLRLTVLEHRAAARLRIGDVEQVVFELDSEVRRHPVRERLVGHLMTALFALGRQAEALAVYDRTRAYLAEELGVETGTELQQIHVAILRREPELWTAALPRTTERPAATPEAGTTNQPPAPRPEGEERGTFTHPCPASSSFVGRERELGRLEAEAVGALTGHEHVSCVTGPLGIGKTHLLTELAARIATDHQDVEVVSVHALHDQGVPPHWLWTQALRRLSVTRSGAFHDAAAPYEALLAPLLPGSGQRNGADDARTRFLTQDAVCEVLRTLAGQRPLVFCVDDLHWADPASLGLLEMLARRRCGWRIGLVLTVWDWRITVDGRLRRVLGDILRGPRAGVLRPAELPRHTLAALVRSRLGPDTAEEHIECVYRQSRGNPYFAHRTLMWCGAMCDREGRTKGACCSRTGARSLESLRLLLARMPERERRVVQLCAVAGDRTDLGLLRRVAADEPVDSVLEQLLRAELLREDPHHPGRFRFVSALVREASAEALTSEERRRMRRRIAAALGDAPTRAGLPAATDGLDEVAGPACHGC
ncbi:AAA family ATPase [Streptomyces sp. MUM 203J]|uniref:BTAD domain-containing putative transcriptional regulator n=1 Tax=Streptomyces sp. MUM 203J TaxID=2791990 RepID=UPI001F035FF3|nr:BTAD domain-containing putative transcriptional regulator [Streptomyces sp. MUM 203J]MCH0540332.1 AAA family ATPase [Streptomyces sp. MUM 203J]